MLLSVIVVAAVTGTVSTVASIWTRRKMEKKTDEQTAQLTAQVNTLTQKLDR